MEFDKDKLRKLETQQIVLKMIFNNEADCLHEVVNSMVSRVILRKELNEDDVIKSLDHAKSASENSEIGRHSIEVFESIVFGRKL